MCFVILYINPDICMNFVTVKENLLGSAQLLLWFIANLMKNVNERVIFSQQVPIVTRLVASATDM